MWTSRFLRAATVATRGPSAPVRPYQRVRQAIDKGGRGLLVAAEVFKEFEAAYQRSINTSGGTNSTLTAMPSTAAAAAERKPLTAFCGSPRDVEPLTVLLLKVLCDLRKLEEMRFLFTQCVLELEGQTPSIELFNVYLLAVSMTDTFNEHEIENIVELMRVKCAKPDVITKLSMFMLYLRLGKESHVATWWPLVLAEVDEIVAAHALGQYPLLGLRLQHCFQTLVRLHHDVAIMRECLRLLHAVSPTRCTPVLLVPYMVLGVANQAMPPAAAVEVLDMLEAARGPPRPTATTTTSPPSAVPSPAEQTTDALATVAPSPPPALSSEVTAFRLLSKCAKWGDVVSADYVRAYLDRHRPQHEVIRGENAPLASLLYVGALVRAGRAADALAVVDAELPPPFCVPQDRPKLFWENRRMTLLPSDPLTDLVQRIATVGIESVLGELEARQGDDKGTPVTAASLDLVLGACVVQQDAALAERLLEAYTVIFNAVPSAHTYALLLQCYACAEGVAATTGVPRVQKLLKAGELADCGVALTAEVLRAAMAVTLTARDTTAALAMAELHAEVGCTVDVRQGAWLLRELALLVDAEGMRLALRTLRASKSPVDSNSLALCVSTLTQWGVPCEDLANI